MSLRLLLFSPGKCLDSGQESRCPPHFLTSLGVRALPAAGGILLGGPSWRPPSRGLFLFWSRKAARSSRRWLPLLYPAATINQKLGQTAASMIFPRNFLSFRKPLLLPLILNQKMIRSTHSKSRNHAKTHDYPLIHSDRFILLLFSI